MSIRWFTYQTFSGEITAVYKTSWNESQLVSEFVWSNVKAEWFPTQVVLNWNFNGDNFVEEITEAEAMKLLPAEAR